MKIEMKIAKNGTKMYYVRDNETSKLRRISAEKATEIEAANVAPVNTDNTIDMTLYNTFMLWAEKISNGQHDAVYPFVAKLKEVFAFDADKEEIIDAIKTDDLNGARRYLSQFNFTVKDEAGYLHKLTATHGDEYVLGYMPAANSITADVVVPPAEETDDREADSGTLHAPRGKSPADVQPENADETEGILGKKIMPATADQSTASKEIANTNTHGNDSTNGGAVQQVISAEAYKKIDVAAKVVAFCKRSDTLLKIEIENNNLLADNYAAFVEELKATKDYKTEYKACLQRYLDQFNVIVAEPVKTEPPAQKPVVDAEPFISCYAPEPAKPEPAEPAPVEVKEPVKPSKPKPTDKPKPALAVVKPKIVQLPTRDALIDSLFDGGASDLAFAKRLEKFCGDRVKWCDEAKHWYLYSGGVWKKNSGENSAVSHFAADLAETMQQHASNDAEHKLAAAFQSAKKVGCSIGMLKACHSVRITLDDLDKHDELLNCLNGVVDLQTGKFYPDADPALLLTKQAGAAYVPNAQSSLVEDFFTAIQPDDETCAGLLRWLGYCLTAKTNEHKFAVWTGERGANGKSTLSGVMLKLLKSYGTGLASRALLKNNRPADANAATTAINALEGVRFALAEELPIDAEIDSSLVKTLSGGDEINLRLNYGEYRTVPNLAKINISGNYLPRIENVNDGGMRRRLLNFAFNVRFGIDRPADPTLKEKLILPENLQALLALLVREAVAWYRGDGLIISSLMKAETQRQLDASNFVADFISDYYVQAPNAYVKAKDFIDELKREYPRECSRFKRADLVKLIAAQDGVIYGDDRLHCRVFKGIGKLARDSDFDSEPVGKDVATPF